MNKPLAILLLVAAVTGSYELGKRRADRWWEKNGPMVIVATVRPPLAPPVYSTKELLASDKSCGFAAICLKPDGNVSMNDSVGWTIENIYIDEVHHKIIGNSPYIAPIPICLAPECNPDDPKFIWQNAAPTPADQSKER